MFGGVALPLDQLSAVQIVRHGLSRHVHVCLGVLEVQFLASDAERLLPELYGGELPILRRGNRLGESAKLPYTAEE